MKRLSVPLLLVLLLQTIVFAQDEDNVIAKRVREAYLIPIEGLLAQNEPWLATMAGTQSDSDSNTQVVFEEEQRRLVINAIKNGEELKLSVFEKLWSSSDWFKEFQFELAKGNPAVNTSS